MFKKILIASPTASAKHYCFKEWIDNVMNFKYPNFQVRLFDNTLDSGESVAFQNDYFHSKYGKNNDTFLAIRSDVNAEQGIIERMAISSNDCRKYALDNGFTHLLMLESDIFPVPYIIEELLYHNKPVIGGLYYVDMGASRRLMLQQRIYRSDRHIVSDNATARHDVDFCDGELKTASHIGLGCIMISRNVLEKIPFRWADWRTTGGIAMHPDVTFAEDCFRNKIKIFANTTLICRHENKVWDIDVYKKGVKV